LLQEALVIEAKARGMLRKIYVERRSREGGSQSQR